MTKEEQAELLKLRAENAALKLAVPVVACTLKMSDKGCVTLTGIRMPYGVSFYPSEWDVIEAQLPNVKAFIQANIEELTRRGGLTRQAKAAARSAATPAATAAGLAIAVGGPQARRPEDMSREELLAFYGKK